MEMAQASGSSSSGNTNADSQRKRRNYFVTFWTHDYPKELPKNTKYLVTCEDTTKDGKYHGHAFIYFNCQRPMSAVKKLFGNDCHCEIPIRNSECINYVLDETKRKHDFHEYGSKPMDNGVHNMEAVLECQTISEVMEKLPDTYVKYHNGIKELMKLKQSKNRYYKAPEVIWIYGPTGSGKSREAFENGAINVTYSNGFFSDWFDSRIICIEEMRGEIPYSELLKLLDGYHNYYSVNIKGGSKLVDLDKIYITSPLHPRDCYWRQNEKKDSINQLLRRITEIKEKKIE